MMKSKEGRRQKSKIQRASLSILLLAICLLPLVFGQSDEFWRSPVAPNQFDVIRDAASHSDYQLEQWSYSGHLSTNDERRFAYQLRFIRAGINFKPGNPSRWAVRDLFVSQLAVIDVHGKQFKTATRINRSGIGWAGASSQGLHLWNDDWEVRQEKTGTILRAAESGDEKEIAIELSLGEERRMIAHGSEGVFQKGFLPINASHYYSLTRMPTRGFLSIDGKRIEVTGTSWMDHEFGASFLEEGQSGWDWFAIELDDGTELMVYQLRLKDGTRDEYSIATMVEVNGAQQSLRADQFELQPITRWTSAASGSSYPTRWRVKIPEKQIELDIAAVFEGQEFSDNSSIGVSYWKGAMDVAGLLNGRSVRGRGFLEMTGYAGGAAFVLGE